MIRLAQTRPGIRRGCLLIVVIGMLAWLPACGSIGRSGEELDQADDSILSDTVKELASDMTFIFTGTLVRRETIVKNDVRCVTANVFSVDRMLKAYGPWDGVELILAGVNLSSFVDMHPYPPVISAVVGQSYLVFAMVTVYGDMPYATTLRVEIMPLEADGSLRTSYAVYSEKFYPFLSKKGVQANPVDAVVRSGGCDSPPPAPYHAATEDLDPAGLATASDIVVRVRLTPVRTSRNVMYTIYRVEALDEPLKNTLDLPVPETVSLRHNEIGDAPCLLLLREEYGVLYPTGLPLFETIPETDPKAWDAVMTALGTDGK